MTFIKSLALAITAVFALAFFAQASTEAPTRIAIHVDDNDPKRMNMALNNAANVQKYYDGIGEEVEIRIVAYGPGLHMLRADTSPVADRIATMSLELSNLTFAACGNTHAAMSKKSQKTVELLDEAEMVPSGVVELVELQKDGWAYIRP